MKILIVGIGFRDYEKAIVDKLKQRGHTVDYMSSVGLTKLNSLLLRLKAIKLARFLADRRLTSLIKRITEDYEKIILIKGENFQQYHIDLLKERCPKSSLTLYLWDSIQRIANADILLSNIDDIFTFDRLDAIENRLKFLPLFYREKLDVVSDYDYDLFFTGFYHSDRLNIVKDIYRQCREQGITFKGVVVTGRIQYLLEKYIKKTLNKDELELLSCHPMSYSEYVDFNNKSRCILDIAHPKQSGLTMRTIEAIGFNRNLITTNADIVNYNDIPIDRYRVLDRNNVCLDVKFIKSTPIYYSNKKYSLDYFLDRLLTVSSK